MNGHLMAAVGCLYAVCVPIMAVLVLSEWDRSRWFRAVAVVPGRRPKRVRGTTTGQQNTSAPRVEHGHLLSHLPGGGWFHLADLSPCGLKLLPSTCWRQHEPVRPDCGCLDEWDIRSEVEYRNSQSAITDPRSAR